MPNLCVTTHWSITSREHDFKGAAWNFDHIDQQNRFRYGLLGISKVVQRLKDASCKLPFMNENKNA